MTRSGALHSYLVRWLVVPGVVTVIGTIGSVVMVRAQTPSEQSTPVAPVYARAKQLVVNGNGAAGRLLVDSMLAAAKPDTPAYAEALYWRASLSTSLRDAEKDLQRIVIEYPLSPRSNDALFQLSQLEAARGDRAAAALHLDRYLLESPESPDRARAGLLLVRISFERNDARTGCLALGRALHAVSADAVELRNQLLYYSPRCEGVDTTSAAAHAAIPTKAPVVAPPVSKGQDDSAAHSHPAAGRFTLQVAAYSTRGDAEALAAKLKKRGLDTRVVGTKKPFRVRVGHYATRAAANAAAKELQAKKINSFITVVGTGDR